MGRLLWDSWGSDKEYVSLPLKLLGGLPPPPAPLATPPPAFSSYAYGTLFTAHVLAGNMAFQKLHSYDTIFYENEASLLR